MNENKGFNQNLFDWPKNLTRKLVNYFPPLPVKLEKSVKITSVANMAFVALAHLGNCGTKKSFM